MELVKLGERTYCIKNNTNIGVYLVNDKDVYLIDTGIDKDAGRKILKIINENNFNVVGIINTHSNADHIGGNGIISERTGASILSHGIENAFMKDTILEPSFLYGGYPFKELRNKFLMAKNNSLVLEIEDNLPRGLEWFRLGGHFFDMIGIKTSDNVYFLGDSLFSEETINKYHVFFIYDVSAYLETLNYLDSINGTFFVPSHVEPLNNIKELIALNREKIYEIENTLLEICQSRKKFEDILKEIFDKYQLIMNTNQYVLVGSTIKSYLSWMRDNEKLEIEIDNNYMYFKTV